MASLPARSQPTVPELAEQLEHHPPIEETVADVIEIVLIERLLKA